MIKPIVLNNPPFTPDEDQVIYMEWQHYKGMNAFIRKNYEWLMRHLRLRCCDLKRVLRLHAAPAEQHGSCNGYK